MDKNDPKRLVKSLVQIIKAQDDLLTAYRLGRQPRESTFDTLHHKDNTLSDARAFLGDARTTP